MRLATVHRKQKKREYRALWITRLTAACLAHGMTYSRFIQGLIKAKITLNRKVLSDIAIRDPEGFKFIDEQAKASLS